MTRLPPLSREAAERDADLRLLFKQSQANVASLSAVDRALLEIDQRNSFVRGLTSDMPDDAGSVLAAEVRRLRKQLGPLALVGGFEFGRLVAKHKGSEWEGRVCGFYSTAMTPLGFAVESEAHRGSVQIYPEAALALSHDAHAIRESGRTS